VDGDETVREASDVGEADESILAGAAEAEELQVAPLRRAGGSEHPAGFAEAATDTPGEAGRPAEHRRPRRRG